MKVLTSNSLKWSSPLCFNDPFDVPLKLEFDYTSSDFFQAVNARIADLVDANMDMPPFCAGSMRVLFETVKNEPPETRPELLRVLREDSGKMPLPGPVLKRLTDRWDQFYPHLRILCVSERPDIAPMWSHYADDHQGVVVELTVIKGKLCALAGAHPVRYQEEPPKLWSLERHVDSAVGAERFDSRRFLSGYMFVKQTQWMYEREWRVVLYADWSEAGNWSLYKFAPRELTKVIIGSAASQDFEKRVREIVSVKFKRATVVKAIIERNSRQITFG